MKNLKISAKLAVCFSTIAILTAIIIAFNLFNLIGLSNAAEDKRTHITNPLDYMVRFAIAYGNVRSATRDIGRATQEADTLRHIATLETNMGITIQSFRDYLDIFDDSYTSLNREEFEAVKSVHDALITYWNICTERLIPAGLANDADLVFSTITVDLAPYGTAIRENVDYLTTTKSEQSASWKADNQTVGMLVNMTLLIVVIAVILFMITYISKLIGRPIIETAKFFKQAAVTGELTCSPEVNDMFNSYKSRRDEIGQMITDCDNFIDSVIHISNELANIAQGDLRIDVRTLSENDTIGNSLKEMIESFNVIFGEIQSSTAQVSGGAKQIADGSQALAQGASQQSAAASEEMSSQSSVLEDLITQFRLKESKSSRFISSSYS